MAIKFCVKAGKSAVETIELINKAYGSAAMSRANVYRCYARFRDGREDVKGDARSGRPSTASILYSRLQRVTIPDAVIIQFVLLKMGMLMLETCRGL